MDDLSDGRQSKGLFKAEPMAIDHDKVLEGITFNCPKSFQCLNNGKEVICPVAGNIDEVGICVEPKQEHRCQMLFRFPVQTICICPVRKRLYFLYGV